MAPCVRRISGGGGVAAVEAEGTCTFQPAAQPPAEEATATCACRMADSVRANATSAARSLAIPLRLVEPIACRKLGTAIANRTAATMIVIISSISVTPRTARLGAERNIRDFPCPE